MDARPVLSWIDAYIEALEALDAKAFAEMFREDSIYQEIDPFDEYPAGGAGQNLTGQAEVFERYDQFMRAIEQYRVHDSEILSVTPEQGVGRLRVTWVNSASKRKWACDWIYRVTLDSDGRCSSFREWHVVRSKD
jgi:hypothetical protein